MTFKDYFNQLTTAELLEMYAEAYDGEYPKEYSNQYLHSVIPTKVKYKKFIQELIDRGFQQEYDWLLYRNLDNGSRRVEVSFQTDKVSIDLCQPDFNEYNTPFEITVDSMDFLNKILDNLD